MIIARQIRAARGLLGWNQTQLSEASGVALSTIKRLETGDDRLRNTTVKNVAAVQEALERAGIMFIPENGGGAGVRLKDPV